MFLIMVLYNLCTLTYCSFYWDLTAFWLCVCVWVFFSSIFAYFAVKLSICIQVHEDFSIKKQKQNFKQSLSKNFGQLLLFEILLNNQNYITIPGTHLRFAGLKHFF